jgi:polysaccharide pyruvyl transferase WcaK-like protein
MLPSLDAQREALRAARYEAPQRYRILFVGRFAQGPTDVVASLKRALEALGHRVFYVDTACHRQVLEHSSGARGGYGPNFLHVAALRPMLDRFAPQVVVTCAGGVVLDEASAAVLRDRGAVLIGMTLSDPDVQSSLIDYVDRFDYHTTNAALARERYEQAGIHNTYLLPFGIDRDFVLRTVAPDPSLRADVICLGHASGRTDRHDVMRALAQRFKVRVYGNGWPLPGAMPVTGDRLLQAAREATFHVNFPTTRAGFTNVKCGAFESVGAGAALCTAEFDEMAQLFEYGSEIVGYRSADDLGDSIAKLLAEPEALDQIRRRAFHRLVTEHLYEHRWLALFRQITDDVESSGPSVGATRAAEIRHILASGNAPARTVLVSGYFGARNRGDDLLLDAVARGIEARVHDAHVVVAAADPLAVEAEQGLPAFSRLDPHASDYWAARASAVVVGPGGLWNDYSIQQAGGVAGVVTGAKVSPAHFVQLPAMTVAHGGHFHVFGMGVGPLHDNAAKATVRLAGLLASSVVVRDVPSRELLEGIDGWAVPVEQAPDVAYALPLAAAPSASPHGPGYLAVNVRPWSNAEVGLEGVREAIAKVAAAHRLDVVGVPMRPVDEPAIAELFAGLTVPSRVSILAASASFDEFTATLRGASAVLSMRMHTSLIAHRLGRPAVGLAYDPKVAGHFAELGRGDFAVALPVDGEALVDLLEAAIDEGEIDAQARMTIGRLERQVSAALDVLGARLADSPVRAPVAGTIYQPESGPDHVVPLGWIADQMVDLAAGLLFSGNLDDPAREVLHDRRLLAKGGLRFNLAESAPRRGDHVTWQLDLPSTPGRGLRIEMWLGQRYKERPNRRGRIAYEVIVDGTQLFRQDIAAWKPRNTIWIARAPDADHVRIEVRIVALRDCEDWDWGPAGVLRIEAVRALPWDGTETLLWGASSPLASPGQSLSEGRGRNPDWRRSVRVRARGALRRMLSS